MRRIFVLLLIFVSCSKPAVDVVIPAHPKDKKTLEWCVRLIKAKGEGVRRVIVVSKEKMTDEAEFFPEAAYPFTFEEAGSGWIYQQLLKLYAHRTIPGLADHVLILDADTLFLKHTRFLDKEPLFCSAEVVNEPYFTYLQKLLPSLPRYDLKLSGITNHMIFEKTITEQLLQEIEQTHSLPAYQALIACVGPESPLSEYELMFNYALAQGRGKIRALKWGNYPNPHHLEKFMRQGHDYVTCHSHMRGKTYVYFAPEGPLSTAIVEFIREKNAAWPRSDVIFVGTKAQKKQLKGLDVTTIKHPEPTLEMLVSTFNLIDYEVLQ